MLVSQTYCACLLYCSLESNFAFSLLISDSNVTLLWFLSLISPQISQFLAAMLSFRVFTSLTNQVWLRWDFVSPIFIFLSWSASMTWWLRLSNQFLSFFNSFSLVVDWIIKASYLFLRSSPSDFILLRSLESCQFSLRRLVFCLRSSQILSSNSSTLLTLPLSRVFSEFSIEISQSNSIILLWSESSAEEVTGF